MSFDGRHARPTTLFLKQFGASVYTPIALVDGVSGRGQSRAVVASDGYGSTAMTKVVDPALMLDPFTLTIRYDPAQASHDFTLGLGKWNTVAPPEATTIQILGPDGALPDTDFYRARSKIWHYHRNSTSHSLNWDWL